MVSSGTAWLVREKLVVTCFHVVGNHLEQKWWHEAAKQVTYKLDLGDGKFISLNPRGADPVNDLAMLDASEIIPIHPLKIESIPCAGELRIMSEGFPKHERGNRFNLTGHYVGLGQKKNELQFFIHQPTRPDEEEELRTSAASAGSRKGISGAPIFTHEDSVVGVLTKYDASMQTAWATAANCVQALLKTFDSSAGEQDADPSPRKTQVRQVIGELIRISRGQTTNYYYNVALCEQLGFQGGDLVNQIVDNLKTIEHVIPVRLRGYYRSQAREGVAARLYEQLAQELESELKVFFNNSLPPDWQHPFTSSKQECDAKTRFIRLLNELLAGPIRQSKYRILCIIDQLPDLPMQDLFDWFVILHHFGMYLSVLTRGGEKLKQLYAYTPGREVSPLTSFTKFPVPRYSVQDIIELLDVRFPGQARDLKNLQEINEETGGHPALVHELINDRSIALQSAKRDSIATLILNGAHLKLLRRELENNRDVAARLRTVASMERIPFANDPPAIYEIDQSIFWLGIWKQGPVDSWSWSAPVMQRLARAL